GAVMVVRDDAATSMVGQRDEQRVVSAAARERSGEITKRLIHRPRACLVLAGHPSMLVARAIRVGPVQHDQAALLLHQWGPGTRDDGARGVTGAHRPAKPDTAGD